jgi:hypothetical protein
MIYLILTASLSTNRYHVSTPSQRNEEYVSAIRQTLSFLPEMIQPIIVENNGLRSTCLDQFVHNNKPVQVIYTTNNVESTKSKGVNELLDLHEVVVRMGIQANDWIIKLTGRYRATSSFFFEEILQHEKEYDAFVKFYGACSLKFEQYDCILGCYAIRAFFLKSWNPYSIDLYSSAEVAFAKYIRLSGALIKEMETLEIQCHFSEDGRILNV